MLPRAADKPPSPPKSIPKSRWANLLLISSINRYVTLALLAFRRIVVVEASIIALSNFKKTANEAADICSANGGSLLQINDVKSIEDKLFKEYVGGKSEGLKCAIQKENRCHNNFAKK